MNRLLIFLVLFLPTLAGAALPTVRIEPAAPILGKPLTVIIPLPDPEATLAGLPDLGAFEPLAPPLRAGQEMRLVVLPMRPGERTIPPFPLQVGSARQIETAPLTVIVLEGIAPDAPAAPLKGRPIPLLGTNRGGLALLILAVVLIGGIVWGVHRLRQVKLEDLPPAAQLAELRRRLLLTPPETPERSTLLHELEVRRFAPVATTAEELRTLRHAILHLTEGGR